MIERLIHLQTFANTKLKEHGLDDWRFEYNTNKNRMGVCKHDSQTIGLSSLFVANNPLEELEDCILHEIAHAIAGPGHGHNDYWRHQCLVVGAKPERCYDSNEIATPKPNYIIECSACGRRWKRYRLKKQLRDPRTRSSCCKEPLKLYKVK